MFEKIDRDDKETIESLTDQTFYVENTHSLQAVTSNIDGYIKLYDVDYVNVSGLVIAVPEQITDVQGFLDITISSVSDILTDIGVHDVGINNVESFVNSHKLNVSNYSYEFLMAIYGPTHELLGDRNEQDIRKFIEVAAEHCLLEDDSVICGWADDSTLVLGKIDY